MCSAAVVQINLNPENQELGTIKGEESGTLKINEQEHIVVIMGETEAVSKAVSEFLDAANANLKTLLPETLQQFEFLYISPEIVETEHEIAQLLCELSENATTHEAPSSTPAHKNEKSGSPLFPQQTGKPQAPAQPSKTATYSSIFSLARSFQHDLVQSRSQAKGQLPEEGESRSQTGKERIAPVASLAQENLFQDPLQNNPYDRERSGKDQKQNDQEGSGQHSDEKNKGSDKEKNERKRKLAGIQTGVERPNKSALNKKANVSEPGTQSNGTPPPASIENIYIRFMALMARILGQAEMEAHQLYLRIKERTDSIDILTLLLSKINCEKGSIDWTNNEEMKKLIEKARALGVDIAPGKCKWTEEEKRLLKENIQMRKDSMEKVTQLERTDMQRYLQEASQCHQARSNVLKLMKEVMDNIIGNMRP